MAREFEETQSNASATDASSTLSTAAQTTDKQLALQLVRGSKPDSSAKACPASPEYEELISTAEQRIYDLKSMGNLGRLEHKFDCDIKSPDDAVQKADEALKITHDKYNTVLNGNDWAELKNELHGTAGGVGIAVQSIDVKPFKMNVKTEVDRIYQQAMSKSPVIEDVLPGTPAAKAGLQRGDMIVQVGNLKTEHASADFVDEILSGAPNTSVDIVVRRNGQDIPTKLTRTDNIPVVGEPRDLGNGITYIRLHNLTPDSTADEMKQAMEKLPKTKAFVIDLRHNPGGQLDQGIDVSELFVKQGRIITQQERLKSDPAHPKYGVTTTSVDANSEIVTSKQGPVTSVKTHERMPYIAADRPVAVITDGHTASAAEIVTGALHDSGHAKTYGELSFGKGIGQTVVDGGPLGSAVKVTSFHYLTPSGHWPGDAGQHRIGLTPDKPVSNHGNVRYGSSADRQLWTAVDDLKARLKQQR